MKKSLPSVDIILSRTKVLIGDRTEIIIGQRLKPFLNGFRGKQGYAIAAISPTSTTELYKLIQLYYELKVGYIIQGANTSLKGQSTPNGSLENPVVIIRTNNLKNYKILNYPDSDDCKILLVEPGLSLKAAETILAPLGYDLPHKIGSHDLGNTFGASCANGCGGVRVDNRDGRASMTKSGNMGVVALSANGIIYNGFIRKQSVTNGQELLQLIDNNALELEDIELPNLDEINRFLAHLGEEKSYPIHNHRGEIIFAGDGGEGLQTIIYQMYLIRKKPEQVKSYAIMFKDLILKERFYKEVVFKAGNSGETLPILCESMNDSLLRAIVKQGVGYVIALVTTTKLVNKYAAKLLKIRNSLVKFAPATLIRLESMLGRILAKIYTPREIYKLDFAEMLLIQIANRNGTNNISNFEQDLHEFIVKNLDSLKVLPTVPGSFSEKILLQIRNVSAVTTLNITHALNGILFAFDDAIMPGVMTQEYCDSLFQELTQLYPSRVLGPYLYGHDLKQINHNDWIIKAKLTSEELAAIHSLQHRLIEKAGGIPHAEHGIGDYSATDLNQVELIKLVAHRLLNDSDGLANYGGAYAKAYQKAVLNKDTLLEGINFARKCLERELARKTLLQWSQLASSEIASKLENNIEKVLKLDFFQ